MSAYELIQIALHIGNRIDLHWGLFITVHIALLGAIVYIDRPLRSTEKVAALVMYTGFAVVNFFQMQNQILLLEAAYVDIERLASQGSAQVSAIAERMAFEGSRERSSRALQVLTASHGFMFVLVILSVIFDRRIISAGKQESDSEEEHEGDL